MQLGIDIRSRRGHRTRALTMEPHQSGPANPGPAAIDHYRLLRRLDRGGRGRVYAAEDTVHGRPVAIKLIPTSAATDAAALHRVARLRHPHVVGLFEIRTYPGGVYLVMELVDGPSLHTLLGEGRLSWPDATAILEAACRGVAAVHAAGVIHGDVKPGNILMVEGGAWSVERDEERVSFSSPFRPRLTDFDLARTVSAAGSSGVNGTPHFMSPEQCRGESCDERTDVYSLGATYHTLLTGRPPYRGATPWRLMFEHCAAPVPDPRRLYRDIPRACADVVARAMAKRRADRHGGAGELGDSLRALLLRR
jgi:serine/threonine protein kinase